MYRLSHFTKEQKINVNLLEMVAKSLYYSTGLAITILEAKHEKVYSIGSNVHIEELFHDIFHDYDAFIRERMMNIGDGLFVYESKYQLSYLSVIILKDHHYYGSLLLGPYITKPCDEHMINEVLNTHNFSMTHRDLIKTAFSSVPILNASRNYFIQQILLSTLTNDNIEGLYPEDHLSHVTEDMIHHIDKHIELEKSEHNYALELLFLTKVRNGDLEKVIDLYNEHIKTQYLNQTSANPLRSSKNKALSFSTLLSRTIIDGGVEAEKALSLEDYYVKKIEQSHGMNELVTVIERMVIKYTNSILQLSNINHVSVIKNASKYVHMHLSEPIRLNDVANFVNLSPNYFSSLFKREMSLSFADYVNQTRIKESQYLLETTEYSILDIAISVGYNNQNYFTTIFRKFTGITPKQYRMRSAK